MNRYRVYMEFYDEHETEAQHPQAAIENFKAMLGLYTPEEFIEKGTFMVDDLTNETRTDAYGL
jgi:hypothetical protein